MRVIKTHMDLKLLRAAEALPEDYLKLLETHFMELKEAFGNGEPEENFSLEESGWLLVLEKGDNPRGLTEFGLAEGGLPESCPEFVDRFNLSTKLIYRTGILMNNDFMLLVYSEATDEELEKFFLENIV